MNTYRTRRVGITLKRRGGSSGSGERQKGELNKALVALRGCGTNELNANAGVATCSQ